MFIAPMPEEIPSDYRKVVMEWMSQSVGLPTLLRNWGADSIEGLAQASGIPLEKLMGFTPQQQKVVAAIWVESVTWDALGEPASLGEYMRDLSREYGV